MAIFKTQLLHFTIRAQGASIGLCSSLRLYWSQCEDNVSNHQDVGTISLSTSGPLPPSLLDIFTVFVPLLRLTFKEELPGVLPSLVGRKESLWLAAPLTLTSAYLWELSPFSYLMRMVVRVAAELCTELNCIAPCADPPMYPQAADPEHPRHETDLAPLDMVADSPSYEFSDGPPAKVSGRQLTKFFIDAVVPDRVNGSQMYVLLIRLLLTQRSPMYLLQTHQHRKI